VRTDRLPIAEQIDAPDVVYYRCTACTFVWVINVDTGECHAVTVKPERHR